MNTPSLSIDEAIRRIPQLGGTYDPNSNLSIWYQLDVCETLIDSTAVDPTDTDGIILQNLKHKPSEMVSVNGSVNDIGKRQENAEETQDKIQAIEELKICGHRLSPKIIASHLQIVFSSFRTKDGHWLYIAQHYTPKSINSAIHQMIKAHQDGWVTIRDSAGYFTYILKKFHPMRASMRKR